MPAPALQPDPAVVVSQRTAVQRGRGAEMLERIGLAGFVAIFALVRARLSDALDLAITIGALRVVAPKAHARFGGEGTRGGDAQAADGGSSGSASGRRRM
jgi:hypothetical protein